MANPARRGLITASALLSALAATYLWLAMLAGPWRLASGLLDARTHLTKAEKALQRGEMKAARYETLSAVAAARRARAGLESSGPVMDLARSLPQVGGLLAEADHLVRAAELSSSAAQGTLTVAEGALRGKNKIIKPDPDDPKGGARIDISRIREIGGIISDVRRKINGVQKELRAIDAKRIPKRLRGSISDGIRRADETDAVLADAEAGFEILPFVLGEDGPRTYMIIMQNPAEQRGSGGSALRFSPLVIDNGKPELPTGKNTTLSVYDVDEDRRQFPQVPVPEDAWYQRVIPDSRRFGNANFTPDWPMAAELMIAYGRAAEPTFPEVDGMIAVDPLMLQNLMPGVGPFNTHYGNRISERKAVHFLLSRAYSAFGAKDEVRKRVLSGVVERFYDRMIKPAHPTELMQGFGKSLAEKHMQIWLADPRAQAFIERMDWDGGIDAAEGADYLNVVEQNVGGNKLDYFQTQNHVLEITPEGDDAMNRVHVEVSNGAILPQHRYVMGDSAGLLGGVTRPMMNVYVPANAQLLAAEAQGELYPMEAGAAAWSGSTPPAYLEKGKRVWAVAFLIPVGDSAAVTYDYRVPGVVRTVDGRRVYRLVAQHQPKVHPERLVIRFNLPAGATGVRAPGWKRRGDVLVWERAVTRDLDLEVSWQE